MQALAGYGSDSDDGEATTAPPQPLVAPRAAPPPGGAPPQPQPPQPPQRRVVSFRPPQPASAPPPDEHDAVRDEEEAARTNKRRALLSRPPGSGGGGLAALLPKPLHDGAGPSSFGAPTGGGAKKVDLALARFARDAAAAGDSDDDEGGLDAHMPASFLDAVAPVAAGGRGAWLAGAPVFNADAAEEAAADEEARLPAAPHPSRAFRMDLGGGADVAEGLAQASVEGGEDEGAGGDGAGDGGGGGGGGGTPSPDDLLFRALAAEAARGGGGGGSVWGGGGHARVVEVSGAALLEGRARAVANATSGLVASLGPGYEAKLRAEAGEKPNETARRKHQIGSLLHDAKMLELKQLETRAAFQKGKKETRAKYGW